MLAGRSPNPNAKYCDIEMHTWGDGLAILVYDEDGYWMQVWQGPDNSLAWEMAEKLRNSFGIKAPVSDMKDK